MSFALIFNLRERLLADPPERFDAALPLRDREPLDKGISSTCNANLILFWLIYHIPERLLRLDPLAFDAGVPLRDRLREREREREPVKFSRSVVEWIILR